jgi:hypothetical protein
VSGSLFVSLRSVACRWGVFCWGAAEEAVEWTDKKKKEILMNEKKKNEKKGKTALFSGFCVLWRFAARVRLASSANAAAGMRARSRNPQKKSNLC